MWRLTAYRARAGQWRWRIQAADGRIVADSAKCYASRGNARRAARRFIYVLRVGRVACSDHGGSVT
ncbi:MAG: DUF1508 domain-containing protein [Planctomycetes bacterium]|nr:DUF1508 domain-containing protein [Planctomycetota bacterium]